MPEIGRAVFSFHSFNNNKFGLKNGIEFVMNKNPASFLFNAEEGRDDSFF
jgi:hypothetical protein